jgi:LDH2 family malate/lactate/ureidoglycolate dehydrogenase
MVHHPASRLQGLAQAMFEKAGTPAQSAELVAHSLVEADLRGLESHGIMRVARYIGRIQRGELNAAATPRVSSARDGCIVVDGDWGFGQVAAKFGVARAIESCARHGVATVAVARAHHVGRIGEYAEALASAGLACIVMSGGGERGGSVTPYGSKRRALGTNPLAMAVPRPADAPPLVLDFATSMIPEGRVAVAAANGLPVPAGCLVDRDGRPTTDARAFRDGGALVPFGSHKGSALALMIEILATTLAGSMPIALPDFKMGNPTLLIAWSVDRFTPMERFHELVTALAELIRAGPAADGFTQVLLPGELEDKLRRERLSNGIPISDATWNELHALAQQLGVDLPA